jgi:hypothetical protein
MILEIRFFEKIGFLRLKETDFLKKIGFLLILFKKSYNSNIVIY